MRLGFHPLNFFPPPFPPQPFDVDPRYASLKYIGAGAYGCVASAIDETSGRRVAIKKIAKTLRDLTDAKRILRELKLLRFLGGHDNLVFVTDCSVSPPGPRFVDTYIVTELFDSDLHRIIDSAQVLSENHVKYFLVRRDPHAAIASFSHQPPQPHPRPIHSTRFCVASSSYTARACCTATSSRRTSSSTARASLQSLTSASHASSAPRQTTPTRPSRSRSLHTLSRAGIARPSCSVRARTTTGPSTYGARGLSSQRCLGGARSFPGAPSRTSSS